MYLEQCLQPLNFGTKFSNFEAAGLVLSDVKCDLLP
jgi:hypothetical protein